MANLSPEWQEFTLDLTKCVKLTFTISTYPINLTIYHHWNLKNNSLVSGSKSKYDFVLHFIVWDYDMVTRNDHIGDLTLTVGELMASVGKPLELKRKGSPAGSLFIVHAEWDS
jgi:hypothetical protein